MLRAWQGATEGKEPWFEMSYLCAPISDDIITCWNNATHSSELELPPVNPYVATDFALRSGAPPNDVAAGPTVLHHEPHFLPDGAPLPVGALLAPTCLLDVPGIRILHKLVTVHNTPKADALFRCAPPAMNVS